MNIFPLIFQPIAILILAPFVVGVIRKAKARFQNRRGASVFLPYWQLLSLCKKEMTITRWSSWMFRAVPFVVLGSALALAIIVPTFAVGAVPASIGNIFFVTAVVVVGSIFLVFGGMDTGSAFGGMGSSREMTLAALVEPAFAVTLVSLALGAGSWHLDGIVAAAVLHPWYVAAPFALVSCAALLLVLLSENARYPVDNPATHLELTMVHEAMILEYSGPYLAMLEYASMIKLAVFLGLLFNILIPIGVAAAPVSISVFVISVLSGVLKLALGACVIAAIESLLVKMRFYRMQEYMATAFLVALVGCALTLLILHASL